MPNGMPSQEIVALQIAQMMLRKAGYVGTEVYEKIFSDISNRENAERLNLNWRLSLSKVMPELERLLERVVTGQSQPRYFVLSIISDQVFRLAEYSSKDEAIKAAKSIPNDEWDFYDGDTIVVFELDPDSVDTGLYARLVYFRDPELDQ